MLMLMPRGFSPFQNDIIWAVFKYRPRVEKMEEKMKFDFIIELMLQEVPKGSILAAAPMNWFKCDSRLRTAGEMENIVDYNHGSAQVIAFFLETGWEMENYII